jgi:hypothetical protein
VDPVEESMKERQQRESGNGEKTAVVVKDFQESGDGKVTHKDRDLKLMKAAKEDGDCPCVVGRYVT